jgi:hypothetical protein
MFGKFSGNTRKLFPGRGLTRPFRRTFSLGLTSSWSIFQRMFGNVSGNTPKLFPGWGLTSVSLCSAFVFGSREIDSKALLAGHTPSFAVLHLSCFFDYVCLTETFANVEANYEATVILVQGSISSTVVTHLALLLLAAMAPKAMKAMKAMKAVKTEEKSYKKVWATHYLGPYCHWRLKRITRARQYEQRGMPPKG